MGNLIFKYGDISDIEFGTPVESVRTPQYFFVQFLDIGTSRQAHDVNTTSPQRRCNVMTLHRRCIYVMATLYLRHVPMT